MDGVVPGQLKVRIGAMGNLLVKPVIEGRIYIRSLYSARSSY